MTAMPYRAFALASALAALAACSGSDDAGLHPVDPPPGSSSLQVNASATTSYVALGATSSVVTVADPTTSTTWDLAFTPPPGVLVNGGASGPGGVKAYCLCANTGLSLASVEAISASNGAAAFGAVTSANIPADSLFVTDAASQAISGWYDYNPTTHAISTNATAWGIHLASTSDGYAKFHVLSIPTPGQSNAGPVTIQWAVQPTATAALGADKQAVVDLSSGTKVYVNLTTGATSTSAPATWDVALQGYTITVNGGVSGTGGVTAVALVPSTFYTSYAAITQIPAGAAGIPSNAFSADGAGGAFLNSSPYRYDLTSHQVYPTFDVYLVKRGTAVYKVQVAGYYNTSGVFGYVTVRYAKLAD